MSMLMHEDDGFASDADTVVLTTSPLCCRPSKCTSHNQLDQLLGDACGTVSLSKPSLSPNSREACRLAPHNGRDAAEGAPYDGPRHVLHHPSSSSADPMRLRRGHKRMSLSGRIDARRAGYDSLLELVPEVQALPGAGDAQAGRVPRDFVAPLRLNPALLQAKIWSVIYLLVVLMALVGIVTVFCHIVVMIESTSTHGLGLLCDAVPAGVAGAAHVGVCKFSWRRL